MVRFFVWVAAIIAIALRVVLWFCSLNLLFNMSQLEALKNTHLFESKYLDEQAAQIQSRLDKRNEAAAQGSQGPAPKAAA